MAEVVLSAVPSANQNQTRAFSGHSLIFSMNTGGVTEGKACQRVRIFVSASPGVSQAHQLTLGL